MASEIASIAVERGFDYLDAPVAKVTAPHTPVPATPCLEAVYVPSVENVVSAIRKTLDY
jgi:pyruvate dehydrogenase E1 component beta subunit